MTHQEHSPLVSTEWLDQHLDSPAVRSVEVDEDTTLYRHGHIPGAVGWNWHADLSHPVQRDYIDQTGLSELLQRSGVDEDTTVVLYGDNNNWFAAYAYWLLRYRGFDAVRLLDGGRLKWEMEGRALTRQVPEFAGTDFQVRNPERSAIRAFRDEVLGSLDRATFVDVRSRSEFTGEQLAPDHLPQEQPYVAGHIAGALNVPWSQAANDDGTFKSPEELARIYRDAGLPEDPAAEVIVYCRIGERSSHTWFVLEELLGRKNVRNYDGSWTEYGSLVGVPVERGG